MTLNTAESAAQTAVLVGAEIRGELARQRKSLVEMAAALDVHTTTVQRKLSGDRGLTVADLVRYAGWLGVSPADLLNSAEGHTSRRRSA